MKTTAPAFEVDGTVGRWTPIQVSLALGLSLAEVQSPGERLCFGLRMDWLVPDSAPQIGPQFEMFDMHLTVPLFPWLSYTVTV